MCSVYLDLLHVFVYRSRVLIDPFMAKILLPDFARFQILTFIHECEAVHPTNLYANLSIWLIMTRTGRRGFSKSMNIVDFLWIEYELTSNKKPLTNNFKQTTLNKQGSTHKIRNYKYLVLTFLHSSTHLFLFTCCPTV